MGILDFLGFGVNSVDKKGNRPLYYAAEEMDFEEFEKLIKAGADLNFTVKLNENESCSFMYFLAKHNKRMFDIALKAGGDPNAQTPDGLSLASYFFAERRPEELNAVLERGADVDRLLKESDEHPLCYAMFGDKKLFDTLIKKGIDVNHFSPDAKRHFYNNNDYPTGVPLLDSVDGVKDDYYLSALLKAGANVNVQNSAGDTVTHLALEYLDFEHIKLIHQYGADFNLQNRKGITPLGLAFKKKNFNAVKYMLENGGDINQSVNAGDLLVDAVKSANLKLFNMLLDAKLDVNTKDLDGNSPFRYLFDDGVFPHDSNFEERGTMAHMMAERCADPNLIVQDNQTLLQALLKAGYKKAALALIEKGADVNLSPNPKMEPPLVLAMKLNDRELALKLIERGANVNAGMSENPQTPLQTAIEMKDDELALKLIERGANVNAGMSENPQTPLKTAIEMKDDELALKLIERGADMNFQGENKEHPTAAFLAFKHGRYELFDKIISMGGCIGLDRGGANARLLIDAIKERKFDQAIKLMDAGCDVNYPYKHWKCPPIFYAMDSKNEALIDKMLEKNVDLDVKDENDQTPLMRALVEKNFDLANKLLEKSTPESLGNFNRWHLSASEIAYMYSKDSEISAADRSKYNVLFNKINKKMGAKNRYKVDVNSIRSEVRESNPYPEKPKPIQAPTKEKANTISERLAASGDALIDLAYPIVHAEHHKPRGLVELVSGAVEHAVGAPVNAVSNLITGENAIELPYQRRDRKEVDAQNAEQAKLHAKEKAKIDKQRERLVKNAVEDKKSSIKIEKAQLSERMKAMKEALKAQKANDLSPESSNATPDKNSKNETQETTSSKVNANSDEKLAPSNATLSNNAQDITKKTAEPKAPKAKQAEK